MEIFFTAFALFKFGYSNLKEKDKQYEQKKLTKRAFHAKTAPALRATVKTELSCKKDAIMVFFFPANKKKKQM